MISSYVQKNYRLRNRCWNTESPQIVPESMGNHRYNCGSRRSHYIHRWQRNDYEDVWIGFFVPGFDDHLRINEAWTTSIRGSNPQHSDSGNRRILFACASSVRGILRCLYELPIRTIPQRIDFNYGSFRLKMSFLNLNSLVIHLWFRVSSRWHARNVWSGNSCPDPLKDLPIGDRAWWGTIGFPRRHISARCRTIR